MTVKNTGSVDAGTFDIGVGFTGPNGLAGGYSPIVVDGVAAGESVQVSVNISVTESGDYTFTADADGNNDVAESNEDDNTATLPATATGLPNLTFAEDGGFSVSASGGLPGVSIHMIIVNAGPATVETSFSVSLTWSQSSGASGELDPLVVAGTIGPGGSLTESFSRPLPSSGDYTITALIDSAFQVAESNEDDNSSSEDVSDS